MKRSGAAKKLSHEELLAYGMRLLAGRALSAGELRSRLQRRAEDPAAVEATMERLGQYGFIDDARFAEYFASARRDSGTGQQRVLRDLRQRRVSATVASHAVRSAFEGSDETQMIRDWLSRKLRNTDLREYLQDDKHVSSVYRKLRYAGFTSASISRVLGDYSSRATELADEPETDE